MTEETEVQYPSVEEHLAQMRVRKIKNLIAVTFVATLVVGFGYMTARSDTPESAVQGFNVAQEQQLRSVMRLELENALFPENARDTDNISAKQIVELKSSIDSLKQQVMTLKASPSGQGDVCEPKQDRASLSSNASVAMPSSPFTNPAVVVQ
ncbi:hypothetical protein ACLS0R_03680 [Comamonas jiangduensis]|uniref:hypothetical protein n=1 Tax=Comamonas jiangduensis TaxID=1194168 RepID=UPI003BF8C3F7